jgi:DNA-directed RNA polymerase subunit RPC12/RpoP
MHAKGDARAPDPAAPHPQPGAPEQLDEERAVTCRHCSHALARARDRQPLDGAATRTFVNPHGHVFEIAAFREAAGCGAQGTPTSYWTWFAGHAWQYAHCAKCGSHVGWLFTGDSRFFGLLVDRIDGA